MNIEPLKTILDLTNNKQNSIVFFLNDEIKSKLNNYYLYEEKNKDIFINQFIICIKKNNILKTHLNIALGMVFIFMEKR